MTRRAAVWVIDDDRSMRWVLQRGLGQAGLHVVTFESADGVLEKLAEGPPAAILCDIRMPGMDGLTLLMGIAARYPSLPVIIMTAYSDLDSAVAAYQGGAFEYLPKPFDLDEAVALVTRAVDSLSAPAVDVSADEGQTLSEIIGSAPAMQEVFRAIGRLSRSHMTVLVTGESGTGKELVARALHRHSPRSARPPTRATIVSSVAPPISRLRLARTVTRALTFSWIPSLATASSDVRPESRAGQSMTFG